MCNFRPLIVMGMSSDSGRNPIGWRTESDRTADGLQGGALVSSAPTKLSVHQQSNIDTPLVLLVQLLLAWLVQLLLAWLVQFLLAWLVHLRQVHPLKKTQRNRNNIAAGHTVMSSGYTLLYIVPSRLVHLRYFNIARLVHLRQVHPLKVPPEFTLRSSCLLRRRCPCQVLRHRCRGSDRRCCRCGCLSPYWLR